MIASSSFAPARRSVLCLLPLALGMGGALVLLLVAGGPAERAYASTFTYPGCGTLIQDCINSASPGDTILISAGDYTESLTLSKTVSLMGALSSTTILHALPNTRVLTVTGAAVDSSVVISGLTFTGGYMAGNGGCPEGCGGGVLMTGGALAHLSDLRFISNTTEFYGGGLYADGALTVTNSSFVDNYSVYGGGLRIDGPATVVDSRLFNNRGGVEGAGLYALTTLVLSGTQVISNSAEIGAGAAVIGAATITNSDFISNTATSDTGRGAGLYIGGPLVMTGGSFVGNINLTYYGGGLLANTVATLTNVSFLHNVAVQGGGGAYVYDAITLRGGRFDGNQGGNGGGLVAGTLVLSGTQFVNNSAGGLGYEGGGAGAAVLGLAQLNGGLFSNNQCTGSGCLGGGLQARGLDAVKTVFISNTAPAGGGAYIFYGASQLTGTEFIRNSAQIGAALDLEPRFGQGARIVNSLFVANATSASGSIIALSTSTSFDFDVVILYSTIASPSAASGVAIAGSFRSNVGITDTIVSNYATGIAAGGTAHEDYNLFSNVPVTATAGVAHGGHSFIGNPAFRNPAQDDYHLTVLSAAIGKGIDVGVTTDFEGDPRPLGSGFDIGFDEATFSAVTDIGVTKSANAAIRQPGQTLTYTLVFSNAGPNIAAGVLMTDIVPPNLISVSYTSSGAILTPVGGQTYAWEVANLTPSAGGIVTVTGVLSGGPIGGVFTNTALITTAYSDTNPANNTSAVTVTVANSPPVAVNDVYTLSANNTLSVTAPGVLANDFDLDGDPLTAQLATGPLTGTVALHPDGSFTYTSPLGFTGPVTFTYQANDGTFLSAPAIVTITVEQPPSANPGPSQTVTVGTLHALDGSGSTDPQGFLPLTYAWQQSSGPAVVLSSAAISRPTFTAPGTPAVLKFSLTVTDTNGLGSLPATTTVTVTDQTISGLSLVGTNPTVLGQATMFTASVTAGTNITYAWGFGDGGSAAVGPAAVVSHTYGALGYYPAVVTATNSVSQMTATTTVAVDDIPLAVNDAYTTTADVTLVVPAPGVLANDSDVFPGGLTALLVTNPTTGTLVLAPSGAVTYTPPNGFAGIVTFAYRANDSLLLSAPAVVTITVTPLANLGLVKSASSSLVAPGQRLTYTLVFSNAGPTLGAGVLLTDIVPPNLISVTHTSSGAILTPIGGQTYAWQVADLAPNAGGLITITGVLSGGARGTVFTNTATITTTTADANPANNTSAVSVTVANAPPVAVNDAYTLSANTTLTVTAPGVLANDTDANNDVLTAILAAGPVTVTLTLHPDGSFTYTPPHDYVGVVTFTYKANDGLADSNAATVTITVTAVEHKLYLPLVRR